MIGAIRNETGQLAKLLRTLTLLGIVAAVYTELRKPPAERTWHGRLLGRIPYDFRMPSLARVRDAYWNPDSDTVFTDRPVGIGWAVNVPSLLRRVGLMSERLPGRGGRARAGGGGGRGARAQGSEAD